jgi:Ca2+-binding RTX toxin-like protein
VADTITYTLSSGDTAVVSVTVTCVDDAPVAVDDATTVVQGSAATPIDVRANDTDVDGGPKTIASAAQGAHGSVAITNAGGDLTYTPAAGYCNSGGVPDTFTYSLNGGSTASVSVLVNCVAEQNGCTKRVRGTAAADRIGASAFGDLIQGLGGDDTLIGGAGSDCLLGGAGADDLMGRNGDDRLTGGPGNDRLRGGAGNDDLLGGNGDDSITGLSGRNVYRGGGGDDSIDAANGVSELVACGSGDDTAKVDRRDTPVGCERIRRVSGSG